MFVIPLKNLLVDGTFAVRALTPPPDKPRLPLRKRIVAVLSAAALSVLLSASIEIRTSKDGPTTVTVHLAQV
jgi:hypothetical protein